MSLPASLSDQDSSPYIKVILRLPGTCSAFDSIPNRGQPNGEQMLEKAVSPESAKFRVPTLDVCFSGRNY